jgi:glyoxylase-like metal-dependent hydrolase (beta-lactamase superfamily II)
MIIETIGNISDGLHSVGHTLFPAFLLGSPMPVLFDAGISALGPAYRRALENGRGEPSRPFLNLITHAHYDHCGALPYLKRNMAGLRAGCSAGAQSLFMEENAVAEIRRLNEDYEVRFPHLTEGEDVAFREPRTDLVLGDGDRLDLGGGWTVEVLATPGHTGDSLSFYIPGIGALIPGEAAGLYTTDFFVQSEFSFSYEAYLDSLERLSRLDVRILLMAHLYVLTDRDVPDFMEKSIAGAKRFRNRIAFLLDRHQGDRERVVEEIFRSDYEESKDVLQERGPYLGNLRDKVRVVAEGR